MKRNSIKLEAEAKVMFDKLRAHQGEEVTLIYSHYGHLSSEVGALEEVNDFINVVVGHMGIPFVGYGSVIYQISHAGEILYENKRVEMNYDRRDNKSIYEAKRDIFGDRIVDEEEKKRAEAEKKWEEFIEKTNKAAQRDKKKLQEEGLALIKPETKDDWIEFTENNCTDGYSCCIVRATLSMMKKMEEEDFSCEAAEKQIFNEELGLTGFQAGAAANCIAHFAKRGEEFRIYWNKQFGVDEEEKGTVNPAVITIGK